MAKQKMDLSSFMCILIMTIGCLVILLVCNTLIIISNPENTEIRSIVRTAYEADEQGGGGLSILPLYGNKSKQPTYIDIHRNYLVIYPDAIVVRLSDLETEGNGFERLLNRISEVSDKEYIILLLRPRSSKVAKNIRESILDRGIDIGQELYEANRKVPFRTASSVENKASNTNNIEEAGAVTQ